MRQNGPTTRCSPTPFAFGPSSSSGIIHRHRSPGSPPVSARCVRMRMYRINREADISGRSRIRREYPIANTVQAAATRYRMRWSRQWSNPCAPAGSWNRMRTNRMICPPKNAPSAIDPLDTSM